jgi:peptide/nickel transport system substrate-binding protein
MIAGAGQGEHPSFMLLTQAKASLAQIGIDLVIQDLENSSVLFDAMNAGTTDLWVAAWQSTIDPDMFQTHHSSNILGQGNDSNQYNIADPQLDRYIEEARRSTDNAYRKTILQAGFNVILDWGVEIPVYQRQEATIFSTQRLDTDTLPKDMTTYWGWNSNIETLKMR